MKKLLIALMACTFALATSVSVSAGGDDDDDGDDGKRVISKGSERFVPNELFRSTFRFDPGWIRVHSGQSVKFVNRTEAPHTITVVADAPADPPGLFFCREPGGECRAAIDVHFGTSPPTPLVNVGAPGLDAVGDSLFQAPHGSVTGVVSAPAGTTLEYLCAFHPWMQGRIRVV